jgi:hypothetical protein
MSRSKEIGTWTETAVTRVLLRNGFPTAERSALHGAKDQGDITGTPVCWEVKGGHRAETASDGQVLAWMAELDTECVHKGADVGVLVLKRKGVGAANADRWWAVMWLHDVSETARREGIPFCLPRGVLVRMTLADACRVLRALGYGGAA